jgi:hypothetical protein
MYETFNSQSKNIGELLGGNERARIIVPKFQRGYSWLKKHIEAFWTDITTFQKESAAKDGPDKYFLGPIVILPESKEVIQLLDGQQRMATATILFSVMRDKARTLKIQAANDFARDIQREMIEKGEVFALQLGEMDHVYFAETIQADPPQKKPAKLRSHRNIQNAKSLLTDYVNNQVAGLDPAKTLAWLREMFQTVRSDLVMASIPVASERDAFRIFETLNDRGLRLSVPDLLLNYLMRVAQSDEQRRQIRDFWNDMLDQMGRRDINRFLRHMWVSKYGDLKAQDLFSALKVHIEDNSIDSVDFTRTCSEECEAYVQLLDHDEEHLKEVTPYVRVLARQLDVAPTLPLLLSCYRLLDLGDFEKVAKWLLVFVTRYSIISRLDSSGLETVLYKLAREVREKMKLNEGDDRKQKAKACLAHVKDTLTNNAPSDDQIQAAVAELVLANDEARYVVSRLATRMQTDTKEVAIDEANLEHIFPKNPRENEWGGKANQEQLEPYLWHLGNVTMLGERLNQAARNDEYAKKKVHYEQKSELEMAQQIAKTYNDWTVATIEDRAKKLAPIVLDIWNFDNPSRV